MADYDGDESTWKRHVKKNGKWLIVWIGFSGGMGGMAPNLFRVGTDLTRGATMPNASYFLGVMFFFVLGGLIAVIFKETDVKKAFFLGIGLPAMFQSGVSTVASTPVAAAMIEPAAIVRLAEEPLRQLALVQSGSHPKMMVVFLSDDSKRKEGLEVDAHVADEHGEHEYTMIQIPNFAKKVFLIYGNSRSKPIELNDKKQNIFKIVATENRLSGLKEAIGVQGAERWTILLERVKEG